LRSAVAFVTSLSGNSVKKAAVPEKTRRTIVAPSVNFRIWLNPDVLPVSTATFLPSSDVAGIAADERK